jgi:hypothetical protein
MITRDPQAFADHWFRGLALEGQERDPRRLAVDGQTAPL